MWVLEEWPLGKERYPSLRYVVLVQIDEFDKVNRVGSVAVNGG